MQLNILVLQQNLKNIEEGVSLARAANYYALFDQVGDAVVNKARSDPVNDTNIDPEDTTHFSFGELQTLMQLCFSEQLANPERGIATAGQRRMDEKMAELREALGQA
jgi:exocyst complex component 4